MLHQGQPLKIVKVRGDVRKKVVSAPPEFALQVILGDPRLGRDAFDVGPESVGPIAEPAKGPPPVVEWWRLNALK
jgi:hypothetical protein